MADVKIKVDAKGTAYWIAVDDEDIDLTNGETTITLPAGIHYLSWWMIGKPGDTIKIAVTSGSKSLGKIETKITSGEDKAAGVMKLEVK
jgi:hypothetical protein